MTLFTPQKDGGMKRLQMCIFDSDFYLQQVRILHLECKRPSEKSKRRLKSKSHLLKFSYFQNNFFSKLKKFHNFIDVTAIWLFSTIMTISFFNASYRDQQKLKFTSKKWAASAYFFGCIPL